MRVLSEEEQFLLLWTDYHDYFDFVDEDYQLNWHEDAPRIAIDSFEKWCGRA